MKAAPFKYRVFLSSPGDVQQERERAQAVIDRINSANPAAPVFALTRWEQSYYTATNTFQDQIDSPGNHDVVVFIFWKRLGTELPPAYNRADGSSRTGTEYEFEIARDAREHRSDHLPDILVYRKTEKILFNEETVDVERAQKKALDLFWEHWFRSDTGHFIAAFHGITGVDDFDVQFDRHLREWLQRRRAGHAVWDVLRQGSPYRGLAPFEAEQSRLFFGRDVDRERARARFIEAAIGQVSGRRGTPFLLILGPSGSGKSSFLRAGLVPRMLAEGVPAFLEDGSDALHGFRNLIVMPREMGEDLCLGLAMALYRATPPGGREDIGLPQLAEGDYTTAEAFARLAAVSAESAIAPIIGALDRAGREPLAAGALFPSRRRLGLLLAIDQTEELFARPEPDRKAFVRLLAALASSGRVYITGTMRNDFYDRLRQDPDLGALTERGRTYDLKPPTLADYRDIIRQPAHAAGLEFEIKGHRDLVAEIESEAGGEGALPMIAFLLEQLFQERTGNLLTLESYDRMGGAAGALAQRGEQTFEALPAEVQRALPQAVRRLVRKSLQDLAPTATAAALSTFPYGSPERALIDALCEARLLLTFNSFASGSAMIACVRLSHEALLTRWPRLRNLVDADRRDYETLDRLQSAHSLWESAPASQTAGRLLTDLSLHEAEDLTQRWGTDVDEPLRNFVQASAFSAQARRRRRRRNGIAIITALSVLLLMATAAGIVALRQRDHALAERSAADHTARFMVSLFSLADPGENRGNSVTVREVLDRGASTVGKGLEHDPGVRGDLLTAMGQAYLGLGLYESANKLLAQAVNDQSQAAVPAESQVRTLAAAGKALYSSADYEKAEVILRQAVNVARHKLPPAAPERSEALAALADVLVQLEKYPEAEQLCQEALVADRRRGPDQKAQLARTLDTLGTDYFFSGELQKGEATMREALKLHEEVSGMRDALTAQALANLGTLLYQAGHNEEAIQLHSQALPLYRQIYGDEHPEVASLLNNMGGEALMAGHVEEAESLLRQALAMNEKLKDGNHDDLVPPLNRLAMIDGYAGHLREAEAEVKRAEQIARLPNKGVLLSEVLLTRADLAIRSGNVSEALDPLAESRRLMVLAYPLDRFPKDAWRYGEWDTVNAELLALNGDPVAARHTFTAALPPIEQRFGANGFDSLLAQRRGQFVEAQLLRRSGKVSKP
jgi:tetratricopeptide (TPR) repeat protein